MTVSAAEQWTMCCIDLLSLNRGLRNKSVMAQQDQQNVAEWPAAIGPHSFFLIWYFRLFSGLLTVHDHSALH